MLEKKKAYVGGTNRSPEAASQRPLRVEGGWYIGGKMTTKEKWRERGREHGSTGSDYIASCILPSHLLLFFPEFVSPDVEYLTLLSIKDLPHTVENGLQKAGL